jgi:hypothetical protein
MVRISRGGEHTNEFFSDAKYRGKRKSLAASRSRYRELVSQLPPPKTTKGIQTHRNQTGVVGVHLAVCESTYGKLYSSYCASWKVPNGSRRKISFSIKKYNKEKAWKMACIARELETVDRSKVARTIRSRSRKKSPRTVNADPMKLPRGCSTNSKTAKTNGN